MQAAPAAGRRSEENGRPGTPVRDQLGFSRATASVNSLRSSGGQEPERQNHMLRVLRAGTAPIFSIRNRIRQCGDCEVWKRLPLISAEESRSPERLRWSKYEDVVVTHWIVPNLCYETRIRTKVQKLTGRFAAGIERRSAVSDGCSATAGLQGRLSVPLPAPPPGSNWLWSRFSYAVSADAMPCNYLILL